MPAARRLWTHEAMIYAYSDNGELETATTGSDTAMYDYDFRGNLRAVMLPNSTTIEYLIDGRDRRIGRRVNGTLDRRWVYKDQLNPVAELDASGNIVAEYVYATKANVPDLMITATATYRLISDHLGSVRLVVDAATGAVAQRMDYDEFGNVLLDTNPGFQPFGFAGGSMTLPQTWSASARGITTRRRVAGRRRIRSDSMALILAFMCMFLTIP